LKTYRRPLGRGPGTVVRGPRPQIGEEIAPAAGRFSPPVAPAPGSLGRGPWSWHRAAWSLLRFATIAL